MKMKQIFAVMLSVLMLFSFVACTSGGDTAKETGYPSGEVQHQMLFVDGKLYTIDSTYNMENKSEPTADSELEKMEYIGEVESIDNLNAPSKDFQASRMSIGDKIYIDENGKIYVKCEGTTVIRMVEAD